MFDCVTLDKSLLPSLEELEKRDYNPLKFQTKDLDNSLLDYYVDGNNQFYIDEVEYNIVDNPNAGKKGWNPPFFMEEKSRKKVEYDYTGTILVYDFFEYGLDADNAELIWIKLQLTFDKGILIMPITVKELTITPTESQSKKLKRWQILNEKRQTDPVYIITRWCSDIISKVISVLNKIRVSLNKYDVQEFYERKKETK